jgi:hypothetical protein
MSVHVSGDGSAAPGISPRENARQLEGEIAVLRDELTGLVAELDRRRHELTDFKLQARRHVLGVTLTGASLLASAAGFVWLSVWRSRRRSQATARMGRLREAVSRMVDRPDRVAAEPGIPARILTAAANAAVATAIKKVLERSLQRVMSPQTSRDHDADLGGGTTAADSGARGVPLFETVKRSARAAAGRGVTG